MEMRFRVNFQEMLNVWEKIANLIFSFWKLKKKLRECFSGIYNRFALINAPFKDCNAIGREKE
jgi:hypothetical protein